MTVFEPLTPHFFDRAEPRRSVVGTGYQDHPKTLLAVVGTATANLVVLPSAVLPQEEGPLLLIGRHSRVCHVLHAPFRSRVFRHIPALPRQDVHGWRAFLLPRHDGRC